MQFICWSQVCKLLYSKSNIRKNTDSSHKTLCVVYVYTVCVFETLCFVAAMDRDIDIHHCKYVKKREISRLGRYSPKSIICFSLYQFIGNEIIPTMFVNCFFISSLYTSVVIACDCFFNT